MFDRTIGRNYLAPRRQGAKVTGRCPSSRAKAKDLRNISPFGRNDIKSDLGVLCVFARVISFPILQGKIQSNISFMFG
jgi:hypothetical protein